MGKIKSTVAFVDRNGNSMTHGQWGEKQRDHAYRYFREFENERIAASCEWVGVSSNSKTVPKQHWKLYRLNVDNIVTTDGEGRPLERAMRSADPTLTREFRTEQECIDAYEDALVRFGGCEWLPGSDGPMFVEHGNKLTPPPPDVPDTRGMDPDVADLAGSW